MTFEKGLKLFEIHKSGDVIHREECEKLVNELIETEQEKAEVAGITAAKFMWNLSTGVSLKHGIPLITESLICSSKKNLCLRVQF